jgi:hypothetical protein
MMFIETNKPMKRQAIKTPILLLLVALLLMACGGQETESAVDSFQTDGPSEFQAMVASEDFAVGQPRVPIVLYSGPDRVLDAQRMQLTAFDLSTEPPTAGWTGEATNYSDYLVPYWVAYPELPHTGYWGLKAEITKADGTVAAAELVIEAKAETDMPGLGDQPPASQNRTVTTEPDLRKLTSAVEPNPDFYQMTVADALQSGRPSLIMFATPGYCQTALCAPVIKSMEAVYPEFKARVNFIHVEIYKQFNPELVVDETVNEWALTSEPWTFVLDDQGTIVARFGGPVSPRELELALNELVS